MALQFFPFTVMRLTGPCLFVFFIRHLSFLLSFLLLPKHAFTILPCKDPRFAGTNMAADCKNTSLFLHMHDNYEQLLNRAAEATHKDCACVCVCV